MTKKEVKVVKEQPLKSYNFTFDGGIAIDAKNITTAIKKMKEILEQTGILIHDIDLEVDGKAREIPVEVEFNDWTRIYEKPPEWYLNKKYMEQY